MSHALDGLRATSTRALQVHQLPTGHFIVKTEQIKVTAGRVQPTGDDGVCQVCLRLSQTTERWRDSRTAPVLCSQREKKRTKQKHLSERTHHGSSLVSSPSCTKRSVESLLKPRFISSPRVQFSPSCVRRECRDSSGMVVGSSATVR